MVSYKSEFEINDDGSLQKFIENAEKLAGHVEVGVLGDKTHIGGGGGKRPINMADLAAIPSVFISYQMVQMPASLISARAHGQVVRARTPLPSLAASGFSSSAPKP